MEFFWEITSTIKKGMGFEHFDSCHIIWLCSFVVFSALCAVLYLRASERIRKVIRIAFAVLLIADEIFKIIGLAAFGNYSASYLPLHLCSVNIIVISLYVIRPSEILGNFLYTVCLPAAVAALLFPTWTNLPFLNFMHIHSFTVHIMLAAFPIILTVSGEIKPKLKYLPCCVLILGALAVVALVFNIIFDTNFMFLMYAEKGNPLLWFEKQFGSHLIGYPVIISAVFAVMQIPPELIRRHKSKTKKGDGANQ